MPNHEQWVEHPTHVRRAMNVVLSLYHMADHFWQAWASTQPDRVFNSEDAAAFRAELARNHEAFALVRDVAEARRQIGLHHRPPQVTGDFEHTSEASIAYEERDQIMVTLDDGSGRPLMPVVNEVMDFWSGQVK
ncbi:MAG: hypothetical protein U5K33_07790 [Halofilum sp. (in: g-proteobacteria)]|nr:hypothetical protein [Halofilum sp. (in: g-proteobacteria)]